MLQKYILEDDMKCCFKGTPWDETFSMLSILKIYLIMLYEAI